MILLYRLLVTLLSPLLPLVVYAVPRLRTHAAERLGSVLPQVEPGGIWIHAASLGEGRAAEALIAAIRRAAPGVAILRTCTSDNARDQRIGADQTSCLPLDVPFLIAAWLDRVRPRCLLVVEGELWPGLLSACRRRGIPVAAVGGRVGPGLRRLRRVPGVWRALMRGVLWIPADETAARIGGGTPIGELKRDAPLPDPAVAWTRATIVAGCTCEGEEAPVLDAVAALEPRPLLVLAPRAAHRFDAVAALLTSRGERFVRRSTLLGPLPASLPVRVPDGIDVLLLDTHGELAGLYAEARAAFIGGTLLPGVGGHSPAEAQAAGCPVVHGPHTEGHAAAFAAMTTFSVSSRDDLSLAFGRALEAPRALGPRGAAGRAVDAVHALLHAPIPPERPLRPWLYPLAPLWCLAVVLRPRPLVRAPVPVLSVGGLTAGGSGKTPVAAFFAEYLRDLAPVLVSRGYKRRPGDDVRSAGEAAELGDELAMLARRGHRVVSSPDRMAGIRAGVAAGARFAILDDALQYGAVHRDLEVVVIDARWPTGGGPIPVGTGRVPLRWLQRADVVWVNHGPLPPSLLGFVRPDAVVVQARYKPIGWLYRGQRLPLDALPARPVVAFAGVARPEGFFQAVRALGLRVDRTWVFADHHPYVWTDLQSIEAWLDDHVVVTTEKDAARLPGTASVYALLVEVEIVSGRAELEGRLAPFLAARPSATA